MRQSSLFLLVPILAVGCASSSRTSDRDADPVWRPSVENVQAAAWVSSSSEYRAVAEQAYRLAGLMLDRALADPTWTASPAQLTAGGYAYLRPAVVLDVDETVLDNTTYQARLIRDGQSFSGETWAEWVGEAAASAVPGALAFTRLAESRGVRVIYLTNRDADGEEPTRRNLRELGFPIDDDPDAVLTQGEIPEWRPSDKEPRRAFVAARHRILLLVGDNMGDFVSVGRADLAGRDSLYAVHADWWGTRWIVLPNPQYGSWESAVFGFDFGLPPARRFRAKLDLLRERADQ